jgi:hypothetical protein
MQQRTEPNAARPQDTSLLNREGREGLAGPKSGVYYAVERVIQAVATEQHAAAVGVPSVVPGSHVAAGATARGAPERAAAASASSS